MVEIDAFARQLWEEAKAFLEKARQTTSAPGKQASMRPLNLGLCSFEAHVNAVASDFLILDDLTPQERSILAEQRVELENGQFCVSGGFQMYRLEDQ